MSVPCGTLFLCSLSDKCQAREALVKASAKGEFSLPSAGAASNGVKATSGNDSMEVSNLFHGDVKRQVNVWISLMTVKASQKL